NGVCSLDAAGQPRCTYRCVTRQACDDGDLCTDDRCDTTAGCVHQPIAGCCRNDSECDDHDLCTDDPCDTTEGCKTTPKTTFAAVTCRLDTVDAAIHGASAADRAPLAAAPPGHPTGTAP